MAALALVHELLVDRDFSGGNRIPFSVEGVFALVLGDGVGGAAGVGLLALGDVGLLALGLLQVVLLGRNPANPP